MNSPKWVSTSLWIFYISLKDFLEDIFEIFFHKCQMPNEATLQFLFQFLGGRVPVNLNHGLRGGGSLGSDVTLRLLGPLNQSLMLDYAHRCQTCTLIMVTINFWRNSESSSKINRVGPFIIDISNFQL